jgi:hypothetical protein
MRNPAGDTEYGKSPRRPSGGLPRGSRPNQSSPRTRSGRFASEVHFRWSKEVRMARSGDAPVQATMTAAAAYR